MTDTFRQLPARIPSIGELTSSSDVVLALASPTSVGADIEERLKIWNGLATPLELSGVYYLGELVGDAAVLAQSDSRRPSRERASAQARMAVCLGKLAHRAGDETTSDSVEQYLGILGLFRGSFRPTLTRLRLVAARGSLFSH